MCNKSPLIKSSKRSILRLIFGRTMLILLLLCANFFVIFRYLLQFFQQMPLVFGSLELFTAAMLIYVINTRDNPSVKLSWAFVIATVPLMGAVLYFFVRFELGHRLNRRLLNQSIRESAAFLPKQEHLYQQIKDKDPSLSNLCHYLRIQANAPVYANTQVTYFPLGEQMHEELLSQLEKAKKFIFMEYFLVSDGYMWNSILEILTRKAAQGVEVRFLYDGMNAFYNLPYSYPKQLKQRGIQCKMFAPIRPFVSTHYNNRDHRKITVIDGHTAFTGGINLEDRYINREVVCGHWKDTAVMIRGDAVQSFTGMFLQLWNYDERERIFAPYLSLPDTVPDCSGFVIPYGDNPTNREQVGRQVYLDMINRAQKDLLIMTPYLIPDSETLTALEFAAKRGVDVHLVLPGIPDKRTIFAITRSYYPQLLEAGVHIHEYTPGFVHAKVLLSDDIHAVVGTINLDYRSLYHHFECGAYLYGVDALEQIREDFSATLARCNLITPAALRRQSPLMRLFAYLIKFAAPLM